MAKLKWWRPAKLEWRRSLEVTRPNPKAQKAFERIVCKMKRIAERYGVHYVSMFTFVDGTMDITAKDADDNYVIEEYATWKK